LYLFAAGAYFHLIAKMKSSLLHRRYPSRKIGDLKDHSVPSAGFLVVTIRHRARTRGPRTAEYELEIADRDLGECRQILMVDCETKLLTIKGDRAANVLHLIPNTPQSQDEALPFLYG
jgi:hypothetical protein